MPTKTLVVILFILLLGTASGYFFLFQRKTIEVETTTVERKNLVKSVSASGKIIAGQETTIYAPLSGTVSKLPITEGQKVALNDILAVYDQTPFEIARNQAYSTYLTAKLAKEKLDKTTPLSEEVEAAEALVNQTKQALSTAQKNYEDNKNDATKAVLDAAETNYKNAQASLARLQENYPTNLAKQKAEADLSSTWTAYQKTKEDLSKTEIKAPQDGVIAFEEVSTLTAFSAEGQKIEAGISVSSGQRLFTVSNENSFSFEAEVDENDIIKIISGQEANVSLDTFGKEELKGKTAFIAPNSQQTTDGETAFTVKIALSATNLPIKKGMTGNANFILEIKENALSVPFEAVLQKNEQDFIFAIDKNRLVKKEITLGEEINGEWEVLDGLQEGEIVVIENVDELKEGQRIK